MFNKILKIARRKKISIKKRSRFTREEREILKIERRRRHGIHFSSLRDKATSYFCSRISRKVETPQHAHIVEVRSRTNNIYIMTVESWMNFGKKPEIGTR